MTYYIMGVFSPYGMSHLTEAVEVILRAEAELRSLLAKAAGAGEYDSAVALAGIARAVREVAASAQPTIAPYPETPSPPTGGGKASLRATRSSEGRRPLKGYPRFFREADQLVKVGWSKRAKAEYEHKAPYAVLLVLARALQRLNANGHLATMEQLLPLRNSADGSDIPTYQAYLCLAWLRAGKLIRQHGRKGYSFARGKDLLNQMQAQWDTLPKR